MEKNLQGLLSMALAILIQSPGLAQEVSEGSVSPEEPQPALIWNAEISHLVAQDLPKRFKKSNNQSIEQALKVTDSLQEAGTHVGISGFSYFVRHGLNKSKSMANNVRRKYYSGALLGIQLASAGWAGKKGLDAYEAASEQLYESHIDEADFINDIQESESFLSFKKALSLPERKIILERQGDRVIENHMIPFIISTTIAEGIPFSFDREDSNSVRIHIISVCEGVLQGREQSQIEDCIDLAIEHLTEEL